MRRESCMTEDAMTTAAATETFFRMGNTSEAKSEGHIGGGLASVFRLPAESARYVERQPTCCQPEPDGSGCPIGIVDDVATSQMDRVLIGNVCAKTSGWMIG